LFVIQFTFNRYTSPAEIGLDHSDHRELAVFFRSLTFAWRGFEHKVDFANPESLRRNGLFGFWSPEVDGVWSAGRRSAFAFEIPGKPPAKIQLMLDAHCFAKAFPNCTIQIKSSFGHVGQLIVSSDTPPQTALLERSFFWPDSRLVVGDLQRSHARRNVSLRSRKPLVSILLVNRDKPILTRLAAIATASSRLGVPYEILCVDNGSSADNLQALRDSEVPMRVIEFPENIGFGPANNAAAPEARGEYLLFLNNDAFLRPGTVEELLATFAAHPDCGAAGPILLHVDGSLQEAGCSVQADGNPVRRGGKDPAFRIGDLPRYEPVDYVSAACLMVKRDEFLAMGGFSPKYSPAYYEDTDFCLRLLLRGKRVYLASRASCYHIENATSQDIEGGAWATRLSEAHLALFLQDWADYLATRNPADFPKGLP
jgi:GT2 family glycosyltransferase